MGRRVYRKESFLVDKNGFGSTAESLILIFNF